MTSQRRSFLKQLGIGMSGLGFFSSLPLTTAWASVGQARLPRSMPEAQGVRSEGILEFLHAVGTSKHEFHSFMMARHGHVIAEGWWSPYRAELNHMLYSLSKSFTSTAVGLAKTDGKLSVEQPVISFFPNQLPGEISENLRALKIKHLLTMSVGHAQDSTPFITKEQDWVKAFLALPLAHEPGSEFLYNSGATYMLSAIVQKATGQKVIDFLTPRLFEPLAISGMAWETCPEGINTGGWGLSVGTEALAKFAQLYLQKGRWNNRQLIPSEWVQEATRFKIQQPGADLEKLKRESDWHQGYAYQFWRCRHQGYRGDGAFGQYAIVLPEEDAVIAITSESSNMQGQLNLVWEHLLPAIAPTNLSRNRRAAGELHQALTSLALAPPAGQRTSPLAQSISAKSYRLDPNEHDFQLAQIHFGKRGGDFSLTDRRTRYPIRCGAENWALGETTMPGTPPKLTRSIGTTRSKIAAAGVWKDDATYEMTWRFVETPHHDVVTCHFEGDTLRVEFMNSVTRLSPARKETRAPLVGRAIT